MIRHSTTSILAARTPDRRQMSAVSVQAAMHNYADLSTPVRPETGTAGPLTNHLPLDRQTPTRGFWRGDGPRLASLRRTRTGVIGAAVCI